jgi:hypothetical protein
MFRALTYSSSGGQIVLSQHLVSSLSVNGCIVCRMRADCCTDGCTVCRMRADCCTDGCTVCRMTADCCTDGCTVCRMRADCSSYDPTRLNVAHAVKISLLRTNESVILTLELFARKIFS